MVVSDSALVVAAGDGSSVTGEEGRGRQTASKRACPDERRRMMETSGGSTSRGGARGGTHSTHAAAAIGAPSAAGGAGVSLPHALGGGAAAKKRCARAKGVRGACPLTPKLIAASNPRDEISDLSLVGSRWLDTTAH